MIGRARTWLRIHWLKLAGVAAVLAVAGGVALAVSDLARPGPGTPAMVLPAPAVTVTASATATIWRASPSRPRRLPGDQDSMPPAVVSRMQPAPSPEPSPSPFRTRSQPGPVPSGPAPSSSHPGPVPTITRTVTVHPTPPATTPPAPPPTPRPCLDVLIQVCLSSLLPGGS